MIAEVIVEGKGGGHRMYSFTVRMTTSPVVGDNWDPYYNILDTVPGASLVENPQAPQIDLDIDAEDWNRAQIFVLGLASL